MGKLQIERKVAGPVSTNCYLAINKESRECILIDPADSPELLIQWIGNLQAKPVAILLTHGHFDHCGAAKKCAERYQIPVYVGADEKEVLENPQWNLSSQFVGAFTVSADHFLADQEKLVLAGFELQVLHTPGHTKGSVCYYLEEEKVLFSGDTLFCESVGRSDFPTGSTSALVHSVRGLLAQLPGETNVFPGHEEETTIAHEKEYNPYK